MNPGYETFGDYILLEKLAAGGMAEVHLAKKKTTIRGVHKFVAIKKILPQFSNSKTFKNMFENELRTTANLTHSNVVSVYDYGKQNSQFYIVMEFVDGRNLRLIMNRMKKLNRQFTISEAIYIIKQVAFGLNYAHNCIDIATGKPLNIIHRDISPQNIMLSFEGDIKIVDFGIAKTKEQTELTQPGTLKGKYSYMSPQQVEGQAIDQQTDIFAVGIIIWEMLANQRLFFADNEVKTLRKIQECEIPSLREINPSIKPELDEIVQKALKKNKKDRYQTILEMHDDLQRHLNEIEPNFSIQKLFESIKEPFSKEIIEFRKKQIEYAKANDSNKETEEQTETNNEIQPLSKAGLTTNSELHSKTKGFEKCVEFEEKNQELKDQNKDPIPLSIEEEPNKNQTPRYKTKDSTPLSFEDKLNEKRKNRYKDKKKGEGKNFELSYDFNPKRKKTLPKNEETENTNIPDATIILSLAFALIVAAFLTNTNNSLPKPVEGVCDFLLKKYNKLCPKAIYTPKGFVIVNSMGAQILVDGKRAESGEKISVPANKKIKVKATDPLLDLTAEDSIEVNINETKNIYLPIKTSIKDRLNKESGSN